MKCMMSVDGSNIVRVSDEKASKLYEEGFRYVPKSMWKEKVRDVESTEEEEVTKSQKNNKLSKSQKRHLRKSKKK